MSQEATQNDQVTEPTVQTESTPVEEVRDPQAVLAKNRELLGQMKELKNEISEFKTNQEKQREEKLAEDGKYKELLEDREKKLAELMPVKDEADTYRGYFETKLVEAKEGLTEVQIRAVDGFNGTLTEKLSMAEEFKGSIKVSTSSPGAERPGNSGTPKFELADYLGADGQRKLTKLYYENRDLWKEVSQAKKARA